MQEVKVPKGRIVILLRDFVNDEDLQPGESLLIIRDSELLWTMVKKGIPKQSDPDKPHPTEVL